MFLGGILLSAGGQAKQPLPEVPVSPSHPVQEPLPPPQGQVIIQSHGEPPPSADASGAQGDAAPQQPIEDQTLQADLTDAERDAPLITAYTLDARLRPATAGLSMRAQLTVRNTGSAPLKQLALQISSSLRWESASLLTENGRTPLPVAQHRLDSDADHTGAETELILALPVPLATGASARLDLFYSGAVTASAARLQRLGASAAQGRSTDWDAVSTVWTGMRGFGNVLWYPVASSQLFLAEGNALFQAVGHTRLREQAATVQLQLTVEYSGEPPVAAYFCGRRQTLHALPDSLDAATATGTGLATASFESQPLGFRTLSLFVLQQPEVFADPPANPTADPAQTTASSSSSSSSSSSTRESEPATVSPLLRRAGGLSETTQPFLALAGADSETVQGFSAAAYRAGALLREWLGPQPLSALTALDHEGQPFEDGPLLVAPLAVLSSATQHSVLIQSLTHAWVQTGQPWMDDGLAQFFALLSTEREVGREAATAQLADLMKPVALQEPDPASTASAPSAEPLIAATNDLIYRRKAAAVWWMLRGIVGDGNLHAALSAWRMQPSSQEPAAAQAVAFQHLLERLSHQELGWFFADWVLRDKGLPDLNVTDVAVAEEPAGTGHEAGWLVAVTVRNEGGAVAEVPVVVRSGVLSTSRRLRIPGQTTVTERVLVEAAPTSVTVNDGSTPEERIATHTSEIHVRSH